MILETHHKGAKTIKSFEAVDAMPAELRECVHEFGFAIVKACLCAGVTKPSSIRQLVREIWDGARQPGQRHGPNGTLDWLLVQSGCEINSKTLFRVLRNASLLVVPEFPTRAMLDASLREVSGHKVICAKEQKHCRRLIAALKAGALNEGAA